MKDPKQNQRKAPATEVFDQWLREDAANPPSDLQSFQERLSARIAGTAPQQRQPERKPWGRRALAVAASLIFLAIIPMLFFAKPNPEEPQPPHVVESSPPLNEEIYLIADLFEGFDQALLSDLTELLETL